MSQSRHGLAGPVRSTRSADSEVNQRSWLIGRAWRGRSCVSRAGDPADSQPSRAELLNRGTDSLVCCGGSVVKAEQRGLVLGGSEGDQGIVGGATEDLPGGQRGEKLLVAGLRQGEPERKQRHHLAHGACSCGSLIT